MPSSDQRAQSQSEKSSPPSGTSSLTPNRRSPFSSVSAPSPSHNTLSVPCTDSPHDDRRTAQEGSRQNSSSRSVAFLRFSLCALFPLDSFCCDRGTSRGAVDRLPTYNSDGLPSQLSDLSLAPPPIAPPLSKLAAKAAANKLAATRAPTTAAPPEKKLSKLQLKMLANQSARSARTANPTAVAPTPPPVPILVAAPIPVDPFVREPFFASPSNQYKLAATASSFAFALTPASKTPKSILLSITASFAQSQAQSITNAFDSESPDDLIKRAREGTKLAPGVVPKRK